MSYRNSSHYHNLCGLDDILSDIGIYNETTPPQSSIDWTTFRVRLFPFEYTCFFIDLCYLGRGKSTWLSGIYGINVYLSLSH